MQLKVGNQLDAMAVRLFQAVAATIDVYDDYDGETWLICLRLHIAQCFTISMATNVCSASCGSQLYRPCRRSSALDGVPRTTLV